MAASTVPHVRESLRERYRVVLVDEYQDTSVAQRLMLQNLFGLVSFIPGLAVAIRRLHDQDRSGWLLLLVFIPILGWFALLVLMLLDGTRGRNRFGPDPKNPGEEADVFS